MKTSRLKKLLADIVSIDPHRLQCAQRQLDDLTKPPGSLGRLEELAARFVAASGKSHPRVEKKVIYTFAGDHGVSSEGVSAYPKAVTSQMVYNFLRGGAAINVLARHVGAEVRVVDVGVDHLFEALPGLIQKKVALGTKNIAVGPAMSSSELSKALEVGFDLAEEGAREGIDLFATGEMGIGNTTPSSAIAAVVTGAPVRLVTGKGTGIDEETLQKKIRVIERAIEANQADPNDPLDVLEKLGGFEIAAISGFVIGAAAKRIPVVIDGFISTAGALIACELNNAVKDYLFFAHCSVEAGHRIMLRKIGVTPLLDLGLRLGEGTGAALGLGLVEAAVKILAEMATFSGAGVSGRER